jgi:phosphohistidine phosphatase
MLNLVLIRHAHAGPYTEPDFERNLSLKGQTEANQTAQVLKYSQHSPGIWLVSSAKRTQQTADILANYNPTLLLERKNNLIWYEASGIEYVKYLNLETCTTIYLIGHNPSISYMASYFSNEDIFMDTGNIVHLQWKTLDSWNEVSKASATKMYHFNGK